MNWVLNKFRGKSASAPAQTQPDVSPAALSDYDTELMIAASRGDKAAFGRLYQRTYPQVFTYICRMLQNSRAAEDLLQEVYMKLWRNAESFKPRAKVITWLYRLATSIVVEHVRAQRPDRGTTVDADDLAASMLDHHEPAPDERMNEDDFRTRLEAALHQLKPNQRAVVLLFQTQQLSYEEIAEILGLNTKIVKSLLNRARERIRTELNRAS